jgi:hypothetical protein
LELMQSITNRIPLHHVESKKTEIDGLHHDDPQQKRREQRQQQQQQKDDRDREDTSGRDWTQLNSTTLMQWTRLNPPSPRQTVQDYLRRLNQHTDGFEPPDDPVLSPGPALRPPSPPSSLRRRHEDEDEGTQSTGEKKDTALVLHWQATVTETMAGRAAASSSAPLKKPKKSVVESLKPKSRHALPSQSSQPRPRVSAGAGIVVASHMSAQTAALAHDRASTREVADALPAAIGAPKRLGRLGSSSSSPILVARLDERGHAQVEGEGDSIGVVKHGDEQASRASRRLAARSRTAPSGSSSIATKEAKTKKEAKPKILRSTVHGDDDVGTGLTAEKETRSRRDDGRKQKRRDPESDDTDELEERKSGPGVMI